MILNVQLVVLPDVSVAVQVTVLVPFWNVEPDGGLQLDMTPGQLSVTVGVEKLTTAAHWPGAVFTVISEAQLIVGF